MPRVLIVEDDPKIVEAIEKTLSLSSGFSTRWVGDPAKALGEAIDSKPDLILLDVRLPGGDGRVLLKTLTRPTWAASRSIRSRAWPISTASP
ncbi:MAG: response regulator transcription factor [Elusimicrobia bacterium]|nr:response regulator transcription factor [Elusimicrobiota bacterium]